ncbi:LppU/SCO3897 family protein [Nocardia stercoris]|uniref:Secreted protein n=1 Tax=Nocardia stercoris TaxID=2483361 RepID=A0A3M2L5Y8_9NOCA|nr:hypothetical protein [Nocardia stercoris]RMI31315.1 hypothetical protein EBN03_18300 [Nocardia stercoris]
MKSRSIRAGTIVTGAVAAALFGMPAAHADGGAADDAEVGTCLHAEGLPGPGRTGRMTVYPATCGDPAANMVITAVVGSKTECPVGSADLGWMQDSTGRVLCYRLT